jgi:hypothetical protein
MVTEPVLEDVPEATVYRNHEHTRSRGVGVQSQSATAVRTPRVRWGGGGKGHVRHTRAGAKHAATTTWKRQHAKPHTHRALAWPSALLLPGLMMLLL